MKINLHKIIRIATQFVVLFILMVVYIIIAIILNGMFN